MLKTTVAGRAVTAAVLFALAACSPKGEELYQRASASLDKREFRSALIDLKNLVADEPQNPKARARLGEAMILSGDVANGEIEVQKARDLGATADVLLVPSCLVSTAKAQWDAVLQECRPEAAPAGQKTRVQTLHANALLGVGRPAEAKVEFAAATKADPANVEAAIGYASSVQRLEGPAAGRAALEGSSAAVKERTEYWLVLGGLAAAAGDFPGSEAAFKQAVDRSGKTGTLREQLLAIGGLAESQMRRNDLAAASETSEKLIKLAPKSPLAMQLRGQVLAAQGKNEEARQLLEQVVSAMPNNYDAKMLLAVVNAQQGNLDQAEMHLAAVVANQPDNARAQRLLAEIRGKQGSSSEMLAGVRSALEQTHNDPSLLAMASRVSLASGDREQALGYLAEAAKSGTADAQTQLEIANAYIVAGDPDKALEVLNAMPANSLTDYQRTQMTLVSLMRKGDQEQLLKECQALLDKSGKDPAIRNLVGAVYASTGKPDLARTQFNEALKQKPDDPETLVNLAKLDLMANKPDAAEANFKKVLAKDPKHLGATFGLATVAGLRKDLAGAEKYLVKARDDHPDSEVAQMQLSQFYLSQRNLDKARAAIDAASKALPNSGGIANGRGTILVSSGDVPGAIAAFEQATRLEPKNFQYSLNLARAKLLNKDVKGALDTVDAVLKEQPKNLPALGLGAATGLQTGNVEKAAGYIERIRSVAPDSPVYLQLEGDLALAQKRYKDAVASYDKADPQGQNRNIVLARFRAAREANVSAPDAGLSRWLAAHPEDAEVVSVLAEYKVSKGDVAGALAQYEAALVKQPDHAILNNNVAMLYLQKNDPRALAAAEKAYKAAPKQPAIQDTYGWVLVKNGQADKAIDILQSAARGLPENAEVQFHLASALAKAGRKPDALEAARRAVAGPLPPAMKSDAERLLAELSK